MSRRNPPKVVVDRSKRVKITQQLVHESMSSARFMPPYFAHESLCPSLYTGGKCLCSLEYEDFHDDVTIRINLLTNNKNVELARPVFECPNRNPLADIENLQSDEDSDDEDDIEQNFKFDTDKRITPEGDISVNTLRSIQPHEERIVGECQPVGGRGKKLCAVEDMDEDDKLIYYLKLAKWTEREIHQKFVSEGRINYNQKTIGTRFGRMRRFIENDNDERLRKGTAVWFQSEQSLLPHAVVFATEKIEEERRALEKRKWDLVAEYIQKHEPVAMFSGDACRRQYEAMIQGNAPLPPEKQRRLTPTMASLLSTRRRQVTYIKKPEKADRPKSLVQTIPKNL